MLLTVVILLYLGNFYIYIFLNPLSDTCRELLANVPGAVKSEAPQGNGLAEELGNESGLTPLHFASFSGNENVVRLLLNSAGVMVEAKTNENVRIYLCNCTLRFKGNVPWGKKLNPK